MTQIFVESTLIGWDYKSSYLHTYQCHDTDMWGQCHTYPCHDTDICGEHSDWLWLQEQLSPHISVSWHRYVGTMPHLSVSWHGYVWIALWFVGTTREVISTHISVMTRICGDNATLIRVMIWICVDSTLICLDYKSSYLHTYRCHDTDMWGQWHTYPCHDIDMCG